MTSPLGATSTISGLASGLDTGSIISQLMQIEAQPQTALKTQLTTTQKEAAAYRDVNSAFAALATAAANLTKATTWNAAKATSSSTAVTATADATAAPGTATFSVDRLATTHAVISTTAVPRTTDSANLGSTLSIAVGTKAPVAITVTDTTGTGNPSLADVVSAINKSGTGLSANTVYNGSGYLLQVSAAASGAAAAFTVTPSAGSSNGFTTLTQGVDARIYLGSGTSTPITSSANTFDGVLPGTKFTVGQTGGPVTVSVAADPDAVTNAVQNLVTAANTVLAKIASNTSTTSGSTGVLKGDWSLIQLSSQILTAVSTAVGSKSAASAGLQLTRDGKLTFDATTFKATLASDPATVQQILGGAVGPGADNVAGTPDDTVAVEGIAARLQVLADRASDDAAGILTGLAKGEDARARSLQSQIDDWDLRLQMRQQTLKAQFDAMETALNTLKGQSSWLASQINALPSYSSTK